MEKKIGKALVIGAGIGGIRSALDLAETGHAVILTEKAAHIGGVLAQLDYQFPSNHCGMCRMLPLVARDEGSQFCLRKGFFHENIEIMTATEVNQISGEPGDFTVHLRQAPRWVDPRLCVGCGVCVSVCPVEIPDAFNGGWGTRKAIHPPVPHAVPDSYVIDRTACTGCGACIEVCPTRAIELSDRRRKAFRILVVDDELAMRDSLKEWLVTEGFSETRMAASGPEALEMLARESCHLMLTDIKMPGMDGVELLKEAKERHPDLTVVMMTAYATVETAVAAMKIGATDYFMKPFDPEVMIPLVVRIFENSDACPGLTRNVQAVIVSTGCDYVDPAAGIDPYGYGGNPHVITGLQYERILSNGGPCGGRLVRPTDGKPVESVAFLQCVGSRDLSAQADFCSTVCCMYALKEAVLTKEKSGGAVETTIYYMDLRTAGKNFQYYQDQAVQAGVKFERGRVHSVTTNSPAGEPLLRVVGLDGKIRETRADLVVLAVGQRPAAATEALAQTLDVALNPWGFFRHQPFAPVRSDKSGIYFSGSACGLETIRDSVIRASAAAAEAARMIRSVGGGLAPVDASLELPDLLYEARPKILVVVCRCGGDLGKIMSRDELTGELRQHPEVARVVFEDTLCTDAGWEEMESHLAEISFNRLLIGAGHPHLFTAKLKRLAKKIGLPARLLEVTDLMLCASSQDIVGDPMARPAAEKARRILAALGKGIARLKHAAVAIADGVAVTRRALVVGGGIAGMQAALTLADMGVEVDLVEKSDRLGGNLHWIQVTLAGEKVAPFLAATTDAVKKHPLIHCRLNSRVTGAYGRVGHFRCAVETRAAGSLSEVEALRHGVVVLATGGTEALTDLYGHNTHAGIVTQKELEAQMAAGTLDPHKLDAVVMIQCVGSRQEPRNFCSRVCCPTALKQALTLKQAHPEVAVYILYRDMMAMGFAETYYTRARREGVIFIQYDPTRKPQVDATEEKLTVTTRDPILDADLQIETDLLVLATGVAPTPDHTLLELLEGEIETTGFYREAEAKWRPVASMKEGIFYCGLALAPGDIESSVVSGQAAAQQALRILARNELTAGQVTATVRHAICSRCLRCIEVCPYSARWMDEEEDQVRVNAAMCQGCGACTVACPNGAAVLCNFSKPQVMEMIDYEISTYAR